MITVRITNATEAVKTQKGWLVSRVAGWFVNLDDKVEEAVAEKIRLALAEAGVVAVIERVPDADDGLASRERERPE